MMFFRPLALVRGRGSDAHSPEMRLVLALFEDAIRSATRHPAGRNRREHREYLNARAWVQNDDRNWPFAFANVCDLLGLDASAVRRQVLLGRVVPEHNRRRRSGSGCIGTGARIRVAHPPNGFEGREDDSRRIDGGDVPRSSS